MDGKDETMSNDKPTGNANSMELLAALDDLDRMRKDIRSAHALASIITRAATKTDGELENKTLVMEAIGEEPTQGCFPPNFIKVYLNLLGGNKSEVVVEIFVNNKPLDPKSEWRAADVKLVHGDLDAMFKVAEEFCKKVGKGAKFDLLLEEVTGVPIE